VVRGSFLAERAGSLVPYDDVSKWKELSWTCDDIVADVNKALAKPGGVLWFTDRRGRRVAVPADKLAYIEVGGQGADRRVGFGTT
jgi:hypothetical protein